MLKRARLKKIHDVRMMYDPTPIVQALYVHGIVVDPLVAYVAWRLHSDSYSANWLMCDRTGASEIYENVLPYLDIIYEEETS